MDGAMIGPVDPLDRADHALLAALARELLLIGQLVDRAGMPGLLAEFGLDGMRDVAIEEWQAASPHYTRRMKAVLGITGDGVAEIFKGFQLDVGAPPEFMDFRYEVTDHDHGRFWLDHCGALVDVEPMGDELVRTMCHDIEDPTFPASAMATNARAVVAPVHRPPRVPEGRTPHCEWTVTIEPSAPAPEPFAPTVAVARARAVTITLPEPAPRPAEEPGTMTDYAGPLLADIRFEDFTGTVLVQVVAEIALQIHLLAIGFEYGVISRADRQTTDRLLSAQAEGIAGVAAGRLSAALEVCSGPAGGALVELARVLALHPLCLPITYVGAEVDRTGDSVTVRYSRNAPAFEDGAWTRLLRTGPDGQAPAALVAAARGVDLRFEAVVTCDDADAFAVRFMLGEQAHPESEAVQLTRFSRGADFLFGPGRPLLPLTPA